LLFSLLSVLKLGQSSDDLFSTKPVEDSHIIELYSLIIEENCDQKPIIIHSDLDVEYSTEKVQQFCADNDMKLSLAHNKSFQNQLAENNTNQLKF
jgi:transposase InsO family protein